MTLGVLYISYDGMLEPLGQSQVLGYLKRLAVGRSIHLISFEKSGDWNNVDEVEWITHEIKHANIVWHPLTYHKQPSGLATGWDITRGTVFGLWLVMRYQLNIVHARSYVSSVMALFIKRITGAKFIFDMRGFWADEKVDGGSWPRTGFMYKVAKYFERDFLLNADHVVSLTHAGIQEMRQFPYLKYGLPPISVIPTCANLAHFKVLHRVEAGSSNDVFTMGYVGSVGTNYQFDKVIACVLHMLIVRPRSRLLIVNRGQHEYILERLADAGVPNEAVELIVATHNDVPIHMARMDAGIFFYQPSFSRSACAPTKLGEFLGCGIPCLSNACVGDMAQVLEGNNVGVALESFDDESLKVGLERLMQLVNDDGTRARCVAAAQLHFSLDEGVKRYGSIYNLLAK